MEESERVAVDAAKTAPDTAVAAIWAVLAMEVLMVCVAPEREEAEVWIAAEMDSTRIEKARN